MNQSRSHLKPSGWPALIYTAAQLKFSSGCLKRLNYLIQVAMFHLMMACWGNLLDVVD
jgi:hypothetical protein